LPTETILQLLENGKWHYLKDITEETRLHSSKIENVMKFLAKYDFIKLDEIEQKVKIDPPTNKFLKRVRQLESREKQ
jgi:DNA-binding IclR family transcriptional regulator